MIKKKRMVLVAMVICTSVAAQSQNIRFMTTTHDFNQINELDGQVTYAFQFVNTGKDSLKIETVEASCGCTTPDWSQEAVIPGDTGYVTAQYDPLNRPGKFDKSLLVTYSAGSEHLSESLYIEGTVIPKPATMKDNLPTEMGDLLVKYRSLNFGKIKNNKVLTESFQVYNDGDAIIAWLPEKSDLPEYLQVSFNPVSLKPGELGEIVVTYDVIAKRDLGFVSDKIVLYTTEAEESEKDFHVIATIEEYFPPMTDEEIKEAPRLSIDKSQYDFGSVTGGTVSGLFTLRNYGKSDLEIRKTKTNCGCTVSELSNSVIRPGETATMKVSFNTSGRQGRQYKTITVFSNDPVEPTQVVSIKADVQ